MRKKRSRQELISMQYLSTTDISKLLVIGYPRAKKIFRLAYEKDKQELGTHVLYENKVRIKSVLEIAGINYNFLQKQINSEVQKT